MEGQTLSGAEEEGLEYSERKHLQEMTDYLGPTPKELIERGEHSDRYFDADGMYSSVIVTAICQLTIPPRRTA